VTPILLFADGDATYKGQLHSTLTKIRIILDRLDVKPSLFIIPISERTSTYPLIDDFIARSNSSDVLKYTRLPFSHPLVICYSSGTTGPPKCIVHQQGLILQLKKISLLHNSLSPDDVVMQYSSTTWVLLYISIGHLATGATCICYDGSPMWPDVGTMMKILEMHR